MSARCDWLLSMLGYSTTLYSCQTYELKFGKLLQLMEPDLSLHGAVASGSVALVKQMLEEGADPHAEDEQVCTIAVPLRLPSYLRL